MPMYEYECDQDGEIITLLRPMRDADAPVDDPSGRGRTFRRRQSTFATSGGGETAGGSSLPVGGCCPCGKSAGQCGRN